MLTPHTLSPVSSEDRPDAPQWGMKLAGSTAPTHRSSISAGPTYTAGSGHGPHSVSSSHPLDETHSIPGAPLRTKEEQFLQECAWSTTTPHATTTSSNGHSGNTATGTITTDVNLLAMPPSAADSSESQPQHSHPSTTNVPFISSVTPLTPPPIANHLHQHHHNSGSSTTGLNTAPTAALQQLSSKWSGSGASAFTTGQPYQPSPTLGTTGSTSRIAPLDQPSTHVLLPEDNFGPFSSSTSNAPLAGESRATPAGIRDDALSAGEDLEAAFSGTPRTFFEVTDDAQRVAAETVAAAAAAESMREANPSEEDSTEATTRPSLPPQPVVGSAVSTQTHHSSLEALTPPKLSPPAPRYHLTSLGASTPANMAPPPLSGFRPVTATPLVPVSCPSAPTALGLSVASSQHAQGPNGTTVTRANGAGNDPLEHSSSVSPRLGARMSSSHLSNAADFNPLNASGSGFIAATTATANVPPPPANLATSLHLARSYPQPVMTSQPMVVVQQGQGFAFVPAECYTRAGGATALHQSGVAQQVFIPSVSPGATAPTAYITPQGVTPVTFAQGDRGQTFTMFTPAAGMATGTATAPPPLPQFAGAVNGTTAVFSVANHPLSAQMVTTIPPSLVAAPRGVPSDRVIIMGHASDPNIPRKMANVHGALNGLLRYVPYTNNAVPAPTTVISVAQSTASNNASMVSHSEYGSMLANSIGSVSGRLGDSARPMTCCSGGVANSTSLPVFIQMFPCELHDRVEKLNRILEVTCGLEMGTVTGVENRSETSFIAQVKTNSVFEVIYRLRYRALMDRHGFWYAEDLAQYRIMKEYCEEVRRLPQQIRHFQTDGLPCMPLVVELSRSVDEQCVAAHPRTPPTFDAILPMNSVDRHRAARNVSANSNSGSTSVPRPNPVPGGSMRGLPIS